MTNIFALHDSGGEHLIREAGRTGWTIFAEKVGDNPEDYSGKNFSTECEAICRLAFGWYGEGNIPDSSRYESFAKRCANYVVASSGCHRWIVGNEMNLAAERGILPDGNGQVITPELYAKCFHLVRNAIKSVQPNAEVIVGAVAPWNNQTTYSGNESGDWIKYYSDILTAIGRNSIDGIALHTYTHGRNKDLIYSDQKMNAPFDNRYYHFRTFENFLEVTPNGIPIYITEFDADTDLWGENNGLITAAYAAINDWNQKNSKQIYCLALYRWGNYDKWCLSDKGGSIDDFKSALQNDYKPREVSFKFSNYIALDTVNVRRTPGVNNKDNFDIFTSVITGEKVELVSDTLEKVDGIVWAHVKTSLGEGYVAVQLSDGTNLGELQ